MSIRVEICKRVIAARIDGKANFTDFISSLRRRFRATYRAFEFRVADTKLIVVLGEGPEFLRLNLRFISVCIRQDWECQAAYLQRVIYI